MKKIISILFVATLIFSFAACGLTGIKNFESAVDSLDVDSAAAAYDEDIQGNNRREEKASKYVVSKFQELIDEYGAGNVSEEDVGAFTDFVNELEKSSSFTASSEYHTLLNLYSDLQKSKECFNNAKNLMKSESYVETLDALSNVIEKDTENYSDAQALIKEAKEKLLAQASKIMQDYSENGNYIDAKNYMDSLNWDYFDSEEKDLKDLLEKSKEKYISNTLASAEELFNNKDCYGAIETLRVASGKSGLSDFDEKMEEYKTYLPISLSELEYTQLGKYLLVGGDNTPSDICLDVNETSYQGQMIIYPTGGSLSTEVAQSEDEAYVTYYVNQKYSTLTGTIYRPYGSLKSPKEWNRPTVCKIYGDDVLLYEGPNITKGTYDPIDFSVDITGVRELKIVVMGVWTTESTWAGLYDRYPKICISNLMLQK